MAALSNGRNPKRKGHDHGRDAGGFVAIPWTVLDCPAYQCLSHPAKALLLEVARQFVRDNNGRMLLSRAYMATRGWKSCDTIAKAKAELLDAGFIFQTVQGHRPNKASWYAVTWRALDKMQGYDAGTDQLFRRGAYQQNMPLEKREPYTASRSRQGPDSTATRCREVAHCTASRCYQGTFRASPYTATRTPSRDAIYCTQLPARYLQTTDRKAKRIIHKPDSLKDHQHDRNIPPS